MVTKARRYREWRFSRSIFPTSFAVTTEGDVGVKTRTGGGLWYCPTPAQARKIAKVLLAYAARKP